MKIHLFFITGVILLFSLRTMADVRFKVRSTSYFDVKITIDKDIKEFNAANLAQEESFILPLTGDDKETPLEICFKAKNPHKPANAKNLGIVGVDYEGKSESNNLLHAVSPADENSCEKYVLKIKKVQGGDGYVVTLIEGDLKPVPPPTPVATAPAEPILPPEPVPDSKPRVPASPQ